MKINELITYREVEDSIVIITPWNNAMHFIEETGKLIFEELLNGKNEDEILNRILEVYDVDRNEAEKDLAEFIEELKIKEIFV